MGTIRLICGKNMMVQIKGRGLLELFRMLKDRKVVRIEAFDPRIYVAPVDPKAPFIKSITIITEPPETPSSVQQRH